MRCDRERRCFDECTASGSQWVILINIRKKEIHCDSYLARIDLILKLRK
jgi:hypothetical protein